MSAILNHEPNHAVIVNSSNCQCPSTGIIYNWPTIHVYERLIDA